MSSDFLIIKWLRLRKMDIIKFKRLVDESLAAKKDDNKATDIPTLHYQKVYERVAQLIGGTKDCGKRAGAIRSEILRRNVAFGEALNPYHGIAAVIGDICRQSHPLREVTDADWIEAITLIWENRAALYGINKDESTLETIHKNDFAVGRAVRTLIDQGFPVQIDGTDVPMEPAVQSALAQKFDALAKSVGGRRLLDMTLADMQRTIPFQSNVGQFLMGRRLGPITSSPDPQVPWGFLMNLAMKHISAEPKWISSSAYDTLKALSLAVLTVEELQPYSHWEEVFVDADQLLSYMQKSVLYDSIFTLSQMKCKHAQWLYQKLWSEEELRELKFEGLHLTFLIKLADRILAQSSNLKITIISVSSMASAMGCGKDKMAGYLDSLSHVLAGPNQELHFPVQFKVDYKKRPLLKLHSEEYLVLPSSFVAPLLAEHVVEFCCTARKSIRDTLGTSVERFLRAQLLQRGIASISGVYDYRKSKRSDEKNKAGDCDFVVEGGRTTVFFECKNKLLTYSARFGNDVDLVIDMAKSFIHSQTQAMQHEQLLVSRGSLELKGEDGKTETLLYKNEQDIERVSISLWGFGSLQADIFVTKFLRLCVWNKLSSNQPEASARIDDIEKKYLVPLREMAAGVADFQSDRIKWPLLSMRFLSVAHLLLALDYSTDTESFVKETMRAKRAQTGTRDFVSEYANSLRLG